MILTLATPAMGTRFELVLDGEDEPRLRAAGEAALAEIEECDARLSLFRRDSLLAFVNREAPRRPVRLDRDTFELLAEALAVQAASEGAFDPALAPLMRVWGFHGGTAAPDTPAAGGPRRVALDPERCTVRLAPGAALDLGGIAKGHGLDLAARALREAGVERALLHGGTSTVVALGAPPDRAGWRVRVRCPTEPAGAEGPGSDATVELRDEALAVSAPHGRTVPDPADPDGALGHVLDPRTGAPARSASLAAVLAPTASRADAWSTAALVLGAPPPAAERLTGLVVTRGEVVVRGPRADGFRLETAHPVPPLPPSTLHA